MESQSPTFLAVVARSPSDPAEKGKSKFSDSQITNNKLPFCKGHLKSKQYMWADVLNMVKEELMAWEDKPMSTYKERVALANAIRARKNKLAGQDDM